VPGGVAEHLRAPVRQEVVPVAGGNCARCTASFSRCCS
jgi:hypothetical protein